jgi:acyl carrier protein
MASDLTTVTLTAELQSAFARYLGLPPALVDADEPIALLGLDSLTAAQLALDIEERLGVSVFLNELTGEETIATLAAAAVQAGT